MVFETKFHHFHERKLIWKCLLSEWWPFCSEGDELEEQHMAPNKKNKIPIKLCNYGVDDSEMTHGVFYHEISSICGVWLVSRIILIERNVENGHSRQGVYSMQCSDVNCQLVKLYSFNTVWFSLIWFFQQEISQTRAMRKVGVRTIMQEHTSDVINISSLKWD